MPSEQAGYKSGRIAFDFSSSLAQKCRPGTEEKEGKDEWGEAAV
jgi:hypothetical protein